MHPTQHDGWLAWLCRFGVHLDLPAWGEIETGEYGGGEIEIQQRRCPRCNANFWRSA